MTKWLFLLLLPSRAFAQRPASLEMPDNALIQCLDRIQTFPKEIRKQPGGDALFARLMNIIHDWGSPPAGRHWIRRVGTPLEVPANGRDPVYFECRGNPLFSVSADPPTKEFEISNLNSFDPATQFACFLVRPDSFDVFRKARKAAWEHCLDVSCELQDESGPLATGPEGKFPFP